MNTHAIDTAKSLQRIQKYLDRLAIAKGYHKECIHTFIDKDGAEVPLLAADLNTLLQQVVTTTAHEDATGVLPNPVGWFHRHPEECKNGEVCNYKIAPADRKDGLEEFPLYTEQQVRPVLAEVSAPGRLPEHGTSQAVALY